MGQEVRGERKADKGIGERNFLLPAARDLLRGPPSFLSHLPGFLPFSPSHFLVPTHSRYKTATPSRMLRLTFYTTAGLVALEIIMPALSATPPLRWKDLRGWDPYNGADKVTTNISTLYNLVRLCAFFMSRIFKDFRVKKNMWPKYVAICLEIYL